jgi:hypothetical protein
MDYKEYLLSVDWKAKRVEVIERADHRCEWCHADLPLEVHHRTYKNLGHEEKEELLALCHECHMIADQIRRLEKRDRIDSEIMNILGTGLCGKDWYRDEDDREFVEGQMLGFCDSRFVLHYREGIGIMRHMEAT